MKLGAWKDGLRNAWPVGLAKPEPVIRHSGPVRVFDDLEAASRVLVFDAGPLLSRTALSVEVTKEASEAMRSLGHPGELLIECDENVMSNSISLLFYGASGEGDRTKQIFPCRFIFVQTYRRSAMYDLMGQPDNLIDGTRLAMAAENDLKYLHGWPNETTYEILHTKPPASRCSASPHASVVKGFEGRVRVGISSPGKPAVDLLYNASLDINGKLTSTLPLYPHANVEVSRALVERL